MREIPGGTRASSGPAQLTCPNTDTDHSDQSVPVLFAQIKSHRPPRGGRIREKIRGGGAAQHTSSLTSANPGDAIRMLNWAFAPRCLTEVLRAQGQTALSPASRPVDGKAGLIRRRT